MSYARLYRSTTQKVFGGVAGGIAEYFNMDPVIIRVIFVLATIFGGGGLIIYLVLWIAVPEKPYIYTMFNKSGFPENEPGAKPDEQTPPADTPGTQPEPTPRRQSNSMIGGIILIGIGMLILVTRVFPRVFFSDLWPFLLVIAGVILIVTSMNSISQKEKF